MAAAYRIIDEVGTRRFPSIAVNPVFPLVLVVVINPFLAWLWFAVNAFAFGSPTRWRELGIIALGMVSAFVAAVVIRSLEKTGILTAQWLPYAHIVLSVVAIGFSYWVYFAQSRSFEYYEAMGGEVRNGLYIGLAIAVLYLFGPRLI